MQSVKLCKYCNIFECANCKEKIYEPYTCEFCKNQYCENCERYNCKWCEHNRLEQFTCPHCFGICVNEFEQYICANHFENGIYENEIFFCNTCEEFIFENDMDCHLEHMIEENEDIILKKYIDKYPENEKFLVHK